MLSLSQLGNPEYTTDHTVLWTPKPTYQDLDVDQIPQLRAADGATTWDQVCCVRLCWRSPGYESKTVPFSEKRKQKEERRKDKELFLYFLKLFPVFSQWLLKIETWPVAS